MIPAVETKCIKDPIYGYIRIPVPIHKGIVDKPMFQRLRYVIQAGYTALFPSSTHNRFVHSLGVYFLGRCIAKSICRKLSSEDKKRFEGWLNIFEKACLLHDVGHAPFSHTGEDFYLDRTASKDCTKTPYLQLHTDLAKAITRNKVLQRKLLAEFTGIELRGDAAKPHEVMSAIIGIGEGLDVSLKTDEQREFFARAIYGYKYESSVGGILRDEGMRSFLSCLIEILNSTVIDVDKLDYLLRDSYLLGFDTVRVDYNRLVGSVSIEPNHKGSNVYQVVYGKAAVSVLENVVYARDAERKWLQGHPIVLFDAYLLREAIVSALNIHGLAINDVFCRDCLSGRGKSFSKIPTIRYLCDADILYLMKSSGSELANLYLDRSAWYRPIWKSEFEYNSLFNGGKWTEERIKGLYAEFEDFQKYISDRMDGSAVMNDKTITKCQTDFDEYTELVKKQTGIANKGRKGNLRDGKKYRALHIEFLKLFQRLSKKFRIQFDFALVRGSVFKSGFLKRHLDELMIRLHSGTQPVAFGRVNKTLSAHLTFGDEVFYLFCKEKKGDSSQMSEWLSRELQIFTIKNESLLKARIDVEAQEKVLKKKALAEKGILF